MASKYFEKLNDSSHTFVIAEAGSNWKCGSYNEDLTRAKELIKVAAKAGADAVKFQTYRPDTVYVQNAGKSKYLSKFGIEKSINDIFDYLSMPYEMIPELSQYCKKENILFMSTPFSIKDAKEVDPHLEIHKVGSFEINHVRLVEFLAKTKKPILLSTGSSTYEEIDFAVDLIKKNHNLLIGLLQCTSKYPVGIDALNLNVIPKMKARYNLPVGFSDHSLDPVIGPVAAVALGATIIEKHFTLDRNLPGPDHSFALIPSELELMVQSIRKSESAKGSDRKEILKEELELRHFAKRAIQAIRDIKKGEILKEGFNFEILRPGNQKRGEEPRFLSTIKGKKTLNDIKRGEGITNQDCI